MDEITLENHLTKLLDHYFTPVFEVFKRVADSIWWYLNLSPGPKARVSQLVLSFLYLVEMCQSIW